jgi:hypothetical protein
MKAYKEGEWAKAAEMFGALLQLVPSDPVCRYFIDKIAVVKTESRGSPALQAQFVPKGDA